MLGFLKIFIGLSNPDPLIPDIASMGLVRINGTTSLELEPSLVFYADVPVKLYS